MDKKPKAHYKYKKIKKTVVEICFFMYNNIYNVYVCIVK